MFICLTIFLLCVGLLLLFVLFNILKYPSFTLLFLLALNPPHMFTFLVISLPIFFSFFLYRVILSVYLDFDF